MQIPFTSEQFIEVFERYNTGVFPLQWLWWALGVAALLVLHLRPSGKNNVLAGFLGLLWLWMGAVYNLLFFSTINPAAYLFGGFFILQGLFFLIEGPVRRRLSFSWQPTPRRYTGYFFILFGLVLYPLIGLALGHTGARMISLGLPCPTTIFTFGLLLLIDRPFPRYLLVIPALWALIGFTAALRFGIYQDTMLLVAAIVAVGWLCWGKE